MRYRSGLFVLFVLATLGVALAQEAAPEAVRSEDPADMAMGRKIHGMFYGDQLTELHQAFSDELKTAIDLPMLQKERQKLREELGSETEVLSERVMIKGPYRLYVREAKFEKSDQPFEMQWGWNGDQIIVGYLFQRSE